MGIWGDLFLQSEFPLGTQVALGLPVIRTPHWHRKRRL
jgi:hypothetical protein